MKHNCYIGEWLDYENTELVTYSIHNFIIF